MTDNAEHVRALESIKAMCAHFLSDEGRAALIAAIAALKARAAVEASQSKAESVEGGEWRERYHDRCRVISDWHQRAVALGYDGVNELLALALPCIVNNAGDERPDKDNPND